MLALALNSPMTVAVFVLFFAMIVALAWLVKKLENAKRGAGRADAELDDGKPAAVPYRVSGHVLSPGERVLYPTLVEAVRRLAAALGRPEPIVLASVRFAEVLKVDAPKSADRSAWQTAQNKITNKQADFVLCNPVTTKPLLVIELDDRSHDRGDRRNRDEFVDSACASAGLPVLHVKASATYNAETLAGQIAEKLGLAPHAGRDGADRNKAAV